MHVSAIIVGQVGILNKAKTTVEFDGFEVVLADFEADAMDTVGFHAAKEELEEAIAQAQATGRGVDGEAVDSSAGFFAGGDADQANGPAGDFALGLGDIHVGAGALQEATDLAAVKTLLVAGEAVALDAEDALQVGQHRTAEPHRRDWALALFSR
jgi:hypothetical protein